MYALRIYVATPPRPVDSWSRSYTHYGLNKLWEFGSTIRWHLKLFLRRKTENRICWLEIRRNVPKTFFYLIDFNTNIPRLASTATYLTNQLIPLGHAWAIALVHSMSSFVSRTSNHHFIHTRAKSCAVSTAGTAVDKADEAARSVSWGFLVTP